MAEIARWGDRKWEISSEKLISFEELTFRYQQAADNNNSTEEKRVANQRGRELFPLTFTTTLINSRSLDVRKEIEEWGSLVTKVDYFFLGGQKLGPAFQLRKVEVSDVELDNSGNIYAAKLSFEFKEYDQETTSVRTNVPPLRITASSESKELKQIPNEAVSTAMQRNIEVGDYVVFANGTWGAGSPCDPAWLTRPHEVSAIQGNRYILGFPDGICSWAYVEDLSLW